MSKPTNVKEKQKEKQKEFEDAIKNGNKSKKYLIFSNDLKNKIKEENNKIKEENNKITEENNKMLQEDSQSIISSKKENNIASPIKNKEKSSTDEEDLDLDSLLLNIRIISEIKEYDKLKTSLDNNSLKIDQDYLQFVWRYYYDDNRENSLNRIKFIMEKTFDLIEDIKNEEKIQSSKTNKRDLQRLLLALTASLRGLDNLKVTYKLDVNIIASLNLLIEKINIKINELNVMFKIKIE